ncbi:MAG: caspase family protein [Bacteroidia bacterium]|nr:caspase family protein [Bacteroidia bacterium]
MKNRSLYASLIGINAYPQNPLYGCMKDVLGMDILLRDLAMQQGENEGINYKPLYFLAPHEEDKMFISEQISESYEAPTFENLSNKAFAHFKQAQSGDICLFYYCGHGSQIDAPTEFWNKSDKKNETLVCVDSRTEARELIDKELAYLIWDAVGDKPDVHCLIITDCCHSGNNFRADVEETASVRYRILPSSGQQIPFQQYLGYDKGFYTAKPDGKYDIKIARYVQLAAASAHEKALETSISGGLFTSKLLEVLKTGGTGKSYRELMQAVSVSVRNRSVNQNPVAFAENNKDLNLTFLGGGIKPYQPSFEVRYDYGLKKWIMYGGKIQAVTSSHAHKSTIIQIVGTNITAEVVKVENTRSELEEKSLETLDKTKEGYQAILIQRAGKKLKLGISEGLKREPELLARLKKAYLKTDLLYVDLENEDDLSDYYIRLTDTHEFVLTHSDDTIPMFRRESDPEIFLQNVEVFGRWANTAELQNESSRFSENNFIFKWERIEGENLTYENLDTIQGITEYGFENEKIFHYREGQQPAFRLSIALHPESPIAVCYVGCVFLYSQYGVNPGMIQPDEQRLVKGGNPISLSYVDNGLRYQTLPLTMNPLYASHHIYEITEYLKFFVSTTPLDLDRFAQPELNLDGEPNDIMRSTLRLESPKDSLNHSDWAVFTIKIRTRREGGFLFS